MIGDMMHHQLEERVAELERLERSRSRVDWEVGFARAWQRIENLDARIARLEELIVQATVPHRGTIT